MVRFSLVQLMITGLLIAFVGSNLGFGRMISCEVSSTSEVRSEVKPAPTDTDHTTNGVTYFSKFRSDRSGAGIKNMLYAHAFAHGMAKEKKGSRYGGSCIEEIRWFGRERDYERLYGLLGARRELIAALGLEDELPLACPSSQALADGRAEYLPLDFFNNVTFTSEWKTHIQEKSSFGPHQAKPKSANGYLKVAVHVRRGDIRPNQMHNDIYKRYLPNQYYLDILDFFLPSRCQGSLKDTASTRSDTQMPICNVTIFTESLSFEKTTAFSQRGYEVDLDSGLPQIWNDFTTADVLVLSRSSFSFVPALVNPNLVVSTQGYLELPGAVYAPENITAKADSLRDKMRKEAIEKDSKRRDK